MTPDQNSAPPIPDHSQLDARKKQAIFRATHRGIREMDILFGGFIEMQIHLFSDADMDNLDDLMQAPDWDMYKWITGTMPVPKRYNTPLYKRWVVYQQARTDALSKH